MGSELSQWLEAKKLVLETSRLMLEKGLVVGTSGNVSLRLPPEGNRALLAITPTGRYYDTMGVDDIQILDFEAEPVEGDLPPSMETMLHIGIYRARKNVNAVVHSHSVYASAISVTGNGIPPILEDQVVFLGGQIKLAQYAPSGSEEMVTNVIDSLEDRNAVLLPNHGAIGVGFDAREALTAAELLEKTAKIYLLASSLGKVNPLPEEAVQAGRGFFKMLQNR
jgi:L-ribulose-5-phosphate 4-epimerase